MQILYQQDPAVQNDSVLQCRLHYRLTLKCHKYTAHLADFTNICYNNF